MRVRSWMAALALIGASSILIGRGLSAQGPGQTPGASASKGKTAKPQDKSPEPRPEKDGPSPDKSRASRPDLPAVQLNLRIAGLSAKGCDVEVKPANPSCKFRPAPVKHVTSDGYATIDLRDIELRGADKTCSMAITVREPGQPPQIIYRGFRTSSAKPGTVPTFTCFISSRMAGVDTSTTRK